MRTTIRGAGRDSDAALMEDWIRRGYAVSSPAEGILPPSLRSFDPDFVAIRNDDKVVVAAKSKNKDRDEEYYGRLASAVEQEPEWRFELWLPRWDPESHPYSGFKSLSEEDILARVAAADELRSRDCWDAALVTLWLAFEAAARHAIQENDNPVEDYRPNILIDNLYNEGVLSATEYEQLLQANTIRNTVVHGYNNDTIEQSLLPTIRRITMKLLSRKPSPSHT